MPRFFWSFVLKSFGVKSAFFRQMEFTLLAFPPQNGVLVPPDAVFYLRFGSA